MTRAISSTYATLCDDQLDELVRLIKRDDVNAGYDFITVLQGHNSCSCGRGLRLINCANTMHSFLHNPQTCSDPSCSLSIGYCVFVGLGDFPSTNGPTLNVEFLNGSPLIDWLFHSLGRK